MGEKKETNVVFELFYSKRLFTHILFSKLNQIFNDIA